jgi:hypothetical protein
MIYGMLDSRRLHLAIAVGLGLTCVVNVRSAERQNSSGPDGREFVVRLTPAAPSISTCHVVSFQTGPFGGYGGNFSVSDLDRGALRIRTGVGGQPAATLKIAIWCRGRAMATLNISSLPSSTFEATVTLTPLAEQPMTGHLLPSTDGVSLTGATLHAYYNAPWLCGFFGLPDCMVPQWEVAVERIRMDRTFRLMVPDFAHDPIVLSPAPGWGNLPDGFRLRAERDVAPYDYWLEPDDAAPGTIIPVAARYPELILHPRRH